MTELHEKVLHETGRTLLFIGALDALAVFLLGFALIEIRTFLAPFFFVAGLFLYFQRIGAVRLILASARMLIAAIPLAFIGLLIVQPFSLTLANFRAEPVSWFYVVFAAAYFFVLRWLITRLTSPMIAAACSAKKLQTGNPWIPYVLVALLALAVSVDEIYEDQDIKHKAELVAYEKLGSSFSYKTRSYKTVRQNEKNHTYAIVTFWNDRDLQQTIVDWAD